MTKVNLTAPPRSRQAHKKKKPAKPCKDFPLFPHQNGQWAKKVRQKMHFFGVWDDPDAALTLWQSEMADLLAGRTPRGRVSSGCRESADLRGLVNEFLTVKRSQADLGKLSPFTFQAQYDICEAIIAEFGANRFLDDIKATDFTRLYFAWAKKWGTERMAAEIGRARTVFNFAFKNGIVDKPFVFGTTFVRPQSKEKRLNRAAQGVKMFEAAELRKMIQAASQPLKAMLLLAINAGLGNNDIAQMTDKHISGTWLNFPRPKTGIMRRCPLWPETLQAIEEWRAQRPNPKTDAVAALLFLTVRGDGWATDIKDRPITHATRKLLDTLKIEGARNFYAIRHSFETVAGDSRDQVAVNAIMGHDDGSMGNIYRERLSDARLQAVAEHVRTWLFSTSAPTQEGGAI